MVRSATPTGKASGAAVRCSVRAAGPPRVGLETVLVAHGVRLGAAGVGLMREAGAGGLGAQALVAAPGALVGGVVVVVGVRATHATAWAAPGAGPAGTGVRRRLVRPGTPAAGVLVAAALVLPLAVAVGLLLE